MEKFFNRAPIPSVKHNEGDILKTRNENTDLLGHLRNAAGRNDIENQQNRPAQSSSEQLWDPYFSRNSTYTISDISMSNRMANSSKTLQGWKIVDKKRVYTTFRNGKLVQGEGAEGYKLAIGDAPTSKGKKRGPQEISKASQPSDQNNVSNENKHNVCNNGGNSNHNRPSNSRSNSCIVAEPSKKAKENFNGSAIQHSQDIISDDSVFGFSFG